MSITRGMYMVKLNKTGLLGYQQNIFRQNQTMIGIKTITSLAETQKGSYSSDEKLDGLAPQFVNSHARVGIKVGVKL